MEGTWLPAANNESGEKRTIRKTSIFLLLQCKNT
jgi:hypothetical protein